MLCKVHNNYNLPLYQNTHLIRIIFPVTHRTLKGSVNIPLLLGVYYMIVTKTKSRLVFTISNK